MRSMRCRHILGALLLLMEAPILAVFVVGWLLTGVAYGARVAYRRASGMLRGVPGRVGVYRRERTSTRNPSWSRKKVA